MKYSFGYVEVKDIANAPGYLVTSTGYIINSVRARNRKSGVYVLSTRVLHGYTYVGPYVVDKQKYMRLHRVLAEAFIKNDDPNKSQVNHKNGVKSDNRLSNLEWATPSENIQHTFRVLGRRPTKKEGIRTSVTANGVTTWYNTIMDAARATGLPETTVRKLIKSGAERNGYTFQSYCKELIEQYEQPHNTYSGAE